MIIVYGFVVALITDLILGKNKIKTLPGGSLCCGLFIAYSSDINLLLGGLYGLVGWFIYIGLKNLVKNEQ